MATALRKKACRPSKRFWESDICEASYPRSFPPVSWPTKKAATNSGKVARCHPSPDQRRIRMINRTGRCTDKNHFQESLVTPARQ